MSKTLFKILSSLGLIACLAGCASYRYGTQTFSSAEPALAAQKADLEIILEAIQPTATPVHGKALVALPSRQELRRHYVRIRGNASAVSQEQLDYVCAVLEADQEMLANAMRKRGVFDQLTTTRVDEPTSVPIEENDFLIYRDIDGWFIRGKNSAPKKIVMDASSARGLPRAKSFLESLEERAGALRN